MPATVRSTATVNRHGDNGINDSPDLNIPFATGVTTAEDTTVRVLAGNSIEVADVDADAGGGLKVTASVSHGTLNAPNGDGDHHRRNTGTLTITGLVAAVNTSLAGLTYTPAKDYAGPDTLQFGVDDLGHTGGGIAPQTDTRLGGDHGHSGERCPDDQGPVQAATARQEQNLRSRRAPPTRSRSLTSISAQVTVGLTLANGALGSGNLDRRHAGGSDRDGQQFGSGDDYWLRRRCERRTEGIGVRSVRRLEGTPTLTVTATDGQLPAPNKTWCRSS